MIATEDHRESNWRQAVKEWNARTKDTNSWRSGFAPTMACPKCPVVGMMLTTIAGATTATCSCGHSWVLA